MTTAAPLRSARANAPPATPVDGFVFEAFEAAFELLSDLLSEDKLSEAELLVSDEASELLTLSGCEEAGFLYKVCHSVIYSLYHSVNISLLCDVLCSVNSGKSLFDF